MPTGSNRLPHSPARGSACRPTSSTSPTAPACRRCLRPSWPRTAPWSGVGQPDVDEGGVRMTSADEAARIMIDGLEKNRLHIYVGADSWVMSLAIKLAPRTAIRFVQKQMAKRMPAPTSPSA